MSADWLPSRDTALLPFAQNYAARISAAPATYGFTAADATALSALVTAYQSALTTALTPATRTKTTVEIKALQRLQLVATLRSYSRRIQANPAVTSAQKTDLGLPIYSTSRTPVPPPSTKPALLLLASTDKQHLIRVTDIAVSDSRRKPAGVSGAQVFSYVAATPDAPVPSDLELWRFEGVARKSEFAVDYNDADIGKQAYIVARWVNTRDEPGPVSTTLPAVVYGPAIAPPTAETATAETPTAPKLAA